MSASTTITPALDLHLVTQAPASCSRVLNCYSLSGDPYTRRDEGLQYISNRQRDGEEETWPLSVQETTGSDKERDRVEERGDTLRPPAVNFSGAIPFFEIASFIWIFNCLILGSSLHFAGEGSVLRKINISIWTLHSRHSCEKKSLILT